MPKYINADELIKFLQTTRKNLPYDSKDFFTRDEMLLNFEQMINIMPTADVQQVKHAEWKINCDGYYPYCSNCKQEPHGREMSQYCPHCGCRMDGDENVR